MGAGFSRLNCLTIIQTSQGLAEHLLSDSPNAATSGIVVGYDARHNSRKFAEHAAAVFMGRGITVWWYEELVHTPLVPFAVRQLKAAGGIMITASHNPALDNGYKVYGSNGCQINTPVDASIATAILQNLEPKTWGLGDISLQKPILKPMKTEYLQALRQQINNRMQSKQVPNFVYTPMHGVGLPYMMAASESLGFEESVVVVEQQAQPDPDFTTVTFPNPEENGALDLAIVTAEKHCINLVLANDPDADRFAVAEKVDGQWHQLTGDQVGILLAFQVFSSLKSPSKTEDYMLTSAVSSQMLSALGEAEGFSVQETLTGFKWLGNMALDLRNRGNRVHFAYEEALGYMFPDVVHDKDGILASVIFLDACANRGSPWAELQQLYQKYGYFETANTYWRSPSVLKTQEVFQAIRNHGSPHPGFVSGRAIKRWRDLTIGYDSATEDHRPDLPVSTSGQMISCWLSGTSEDQGIRFTVRASGTEPKIKSKPSTLLLATVS